MQIHACNKHIGGLYKYIHRLLSFQNYCHSLYFKVSTFFVIQLCVLCSLIEVEFLIMYHIFFTKQNFIFTSLFHVTKYFFLLRNILLDMLVLVKNFFCLFNSWWSKIYIICVLLGFLECNLLHYISNSYLYWGYFPL